MTTTQSTSRITYSLLCLILLASLPIKLLAARNMPWEIDFVPVLSRSVEYSLPPVGTLSSVAAYNMPMLQWLHLPALHLTHHAYAAILLTMLTFNILATIAVFCIGDALFNGRVGLAAALLFTLSEVGISSAYTAWAQLLLPGFYALTFLFLWQWRKHEKGVYLAGAGMIATAAFMTHFSAILLYPAMLIFAVITRARWQWRWLIAGVLACGLMLMPYLVFDAQHDFENLRAFIKQEARVAPEVLAQVQYLKPESGVLPREQTPTVQAVTQTQSNNPPSVNRPAPTPRWQRAIAFIMTIPGQYVRGLTRTFDTTVRGLPAAFRPILFIPMVLFIVSSGWAVWNFARRFHLFDQSSTLATTLIETVYGRMLLILCFVLTIISGLILTRSSDQPTYFMGLIGLQLVLAAAVLAIEKLPRWIKILAVVLMLTYVGVSSGDRLARLIQHDDTAYSRFNVSIYRHVSDTVDYIAADWEGGDSLMVSYDIMPEMRNLWWVAAWHSIDPTYRMGMNFDFLLSYHHGLTNRNTDPVGYVEEADYFVVYEPGLSRFNLADYRVAQFGTIYVLVPD